MKNYNLKEYRLGGSMIGSAGPNRNRTDVSKLSGYSGGHHKFADDFFGGAGGMGRTMKNYNPEDYEFEDEYDSYTDEELLNEFKMLQNIKDKVYNLGKSATFSIPGLGDGLAGLNFLWSFFRTSWIKIICEKIYKCN